MNTRMLVVLFLLLPCSLSARTHHARLNSGSELRDWCEHRSARYFKANKLQAYNWTASTINKNNYFETTGEWRVKHKTVKVMCRAKQGATRRQATFYILPE